MLLQQVVRPRDAPCGASLDSPRSAFEENMYYPEKYYDNQPISSNNADVNFDADVQKRGELLVQPIPDAARRNLQSMGLNPIIHSAASITTGNEDAEDIYPNFDSTCSTVLTNSMLNCRQVEEHLIPILQAESGVQMHSTLQCNKTFYCEARDENIQAVESDALIVASLKQDLIGERPVTNGLNFQEILDKDLNVCGIYPCFNGKLCGVEQFIPLISDDWRLFRLKTLDFVHHSFVKEAGLDLWHKRFGRLSNDSVLQTVGHSHGTNNIPRTMPRGTNCPNYFIGKYRRQDASAARVQKTKHLIEQVNWDLNMVK
jgi:hypothetical protein